MRVPDDITDCVGFLFERTKRPEKQDTYVGTAFVVSVPSEGEQGVKFHYLVTARHCVPKPDSKARLFLRINTLEGRAMDVSVNTDWNFPREDNAADIAVMRFIPEIEFDYKTLPIEAVVTHEGNVPYVFSSVGIGIGDDLIICGLFSERMGIKRNTPIARSGMIAAMPSEPILDKNRKKPYRAYLVEMRSIGGLSGSPVFVAVENSQQQRMPRGWNHSFYLLGVIRGHWDYLRESSIVYSRQEMIEVNMGIAEVTPIKEMLDIIYGERLLKERQAEDDQRSKRSPLTLD